jgi:DNA-binding NtrC family response regulator
MALCRDCGLTPRLLDGNSTEPLSAVADCRLIIVDLALEQVAARLFDTPEYAEREILVMAAEDSPRAANAAMRRGAAFYFCKPFEQANLQPLIEDILLDPSDAPDGDHSDDAPCSIDQFGWMRGSSRPMRKLYRSLRKIAPTEASVLITGESGTGKELVAKTLHKLSSRSEGPYVAFNCAALVESLAESELFGHEKGSFSGADRRHSGHFERASGGTLFLDELTEMPMDLQAKLLRVLEEGRVRPVGAREDIDVDVRILCATNRDPDTAIAEGTLREDLFFRVAHIPVWVPPLRQRGQDVAGLAQYFLNSLNERHDTSLTFTPEALKKLSGLPWPGNVRQLRHEVERAYILSDANIEADAFSERIAHGRLAAGGLGTLTIPLGTPLADCERQILLATLELFDGDKKQTAESLGISLKTLYNRLRDYREGEDTSTGT